MPPRRVSKFSKEAQKNSAFGKAISAGLTDADRKLMNAIEFIEGPQGTGITLRPVQRVITKCIFGVPLDWRPAWADRIPLWGQVEMWDVFREHLNRTVPESEYLHIAYNEGRALEVHEPIPTPTGFKLIGEVGVGDDVFSADGTVTKVIHVQAPFLADVYRVSFDDGTSVLAHENHQWLTAARTEERRKYPNGTRGKAVRVRKTSIKSTLEIASSVICTKGKQHTNNSNHAVPLSAPVNLPQCELPLDPYCLGVWLGDGHSAQAIITGEEADCREILEHFSKAGFNSHRLGEFWWSVYGLWTILKRMEVLNNKHIPKTYLRSSAEQRLALLQGLLDSDGTCSKRKAGQVEFSNTNRVLSEGVYELAASLGLKPGWSEREPDGLKRKQKAYRVRWTSSVPVFRLRRKLACLPSSIARPAWRYITAVEPAGKATVRCITVKHPSGLFLFGKNFNVTHNCNIDNWQDIPNLGETYGGYNEACIYAGRRGGKLIDIDEPIPTPRGFIRNGDLKDGDEIFGEDGQIHRVIKAHSIVEEEAFRVTFDDGTSVLAHSGHLWHTYTRKERKNIGRRIEHPKVLAVAAGACNCGCGRALEETSRPVEDRQFRRGHFLRPKIHGQVRTTEEILCTLQDVSNPNKPPQANHSILLPKPVELPERILPLDPYCLGAWLGDGRKIGGNGFTASDRGAPETLSHFSAAGFTWKKSRWGQQWNIYGLTSILRKMELIRNKHIPHEYLWASAAQRLALLQGLMDTDGHCAKDGQVEFCNTNKALAEGVYHLAASLGLKPFWNEGIARLYGKDCGPKCRVTWTGTLPVFRLSRKLARLPKVVKSTQRWRYIVSVESVGKRQMRCITTDNPTGLYLFGKNFNVTHNSELVAAITCYKLYLLLNLRSPQEFFGLVPGSPIDITYLAQDDKGADRLFKKLSERVNHCNFFEPFIRDNNNKNLTFVCEADRHKRDITPTLTVWSLPCLEEHELMWKESGLAEIGEVNVGDIVLDVNANKQQVTHKQYNEKEVWALETENSRGDPLLLTPNHTCIFIPANEAKSALPYLIGRVGRKGAIDSRAKRRFAKKQQSIQWTEGPASDIVSGDYLLFPRIPESKRKAYIIDNAAAKTQPYAMSCFGHKYMRQESTARAVPAFAVSPLVCRLWGLYLAEGSVAKEDAGVNWDFHIDEKPTLARFVQETLMSEFGLPSTIVDKEGNGCRVMCGSVQLARGFMHIFGKGCAEKGIPAEALYWPSDCQQALIRGWLEGDGEGWFVGTYERRVGPTVSKKLAYSLFALGIQAGLLPSVRCRPAYTDKKGISHRESWYVNFNKRERHYRFFQKIGDQEFYWSKVLKNAPTGRIVRVVDISVENTESFLTKMAAVHNCTTNAVRGPSSVFLALDEFAHFRSEKGSTSEDMYTAATPSTVDFHHTERVYDDGSQESIAPPPREKGTDLEHGEDFSDLTATVILEDPELFDKITEQEEKQADISGEVYEKNVAAPRTFQQLEVQDSMIFSISSPLKRVGKMYELHRLALDKGAASSIFTLNCSTAEMNNKVLSKTLRADLEKNPLTFKAEFGGQFLESSESYVTEAAVKACVDCTWDEKGLPVEGSVRLNTVSFIPSLHLGRNYFWGFDLGMTCDASALAIAHLEYGGGGGIRLIYDYIDRMMVGEHFTGPGIEQVPGDKKYESYKVLPLEDILAWMRTLNRILPCFRGATDQHGGQQLAQLLELNGIFNFEMLNITPAINSQMAYALRGYIENKLCSFPYMPKFITEVKLLELEVASKYRIRVQAPMERGAHDDMADAAQLCALLAQNWLVKEGNVHLDPKGISLLMQQQASRPPVPLQSIDGVPLSTLKAMEQTRKIATNTGYSSGTAPRSPWSRRGGRHR